MPESTVESSKSSQQKQQSHLNLKLKERLGYSGIYSQRNYQQFFDALPASEQENIVQKLKIGYQEILGSYFIDEEQAIEQIDRFVEKAFFINLPIAKVVEIHLELIEDLTRKLKLKGASIDFLSDYRLVLIDVIAHLGEMYRSVVKETCLYTQIAS